MPECEVPKNTFLRSYKDGAGYADCYVMQVAGRVTQEDFITAFYTSPLFKIERTILKVLARKPATDADARQLAAGKATHFSAWRVERQSATELLLADFTGRTRSWLMALPASAATSGQSTLVYFGSAVVPEPRRTGHDARSPTLGWAFHALLGFHRLYSRLLLRAAVRHVQVM